MKGLKLTSKQRKWLDSRGGRRSSDVLNDEEGLYVLMSGGRKTQMKVYLPKEQINVNN